MRKRIFLDIVTIIILLANYRLTSEKLGIFISITGFVLVFIIYKLIIFKINKKLGI